MGKRKSKEKQRRQNLTQRFRKYGLDEHEYRLWHRSQDGCCAICGKPDEHGLKLAIDHSHTTNDVRGLLCRNCNAGLGLFGDSTETLALAIQYLAEAEDVTRGLRRPRIKWLKP